MTVEIRVGDCRDEMRKMDAGSVQMCVTSVPYFGLRDYKIPPSIWGGEADCKHDFVSKTRNLELRRGSGLAALGERMKGGGHKASEVQTSTIETAFCAHCDAWRGCFGLEPTYLMYVDHLVEIADEIWRVMRDDGVFYLNIGDSYATGAGASGNRNAGGCAISNNGRKVNWGYRGEALRGGTSAKRAAMGKHAHLGDAIGSGPATQPNRLPQPGLKPKDKCLIPARVAIALQERGWWVRQDNVWFKKNPMPESTYDRTTSAHEFVFQLTKSGDTLLWHHRDGRWVYKKPPADWRWRHRYTREELDVEPVNAAAVDGKGNKLWIKINLWRGFDYYYDAEAIMEPSSPDSHRRAARNRSDMHKWADGGPMAGTSSSGQSIAIGSPSAGRYLPRPAGWDDGQGHHGSVHRNGRRPEKDAGREEQGLRPAARMGGGAGWREQGLREHRGRGDPNGVGMERYDAPGPNSRVNVARVPRNRKADQHNGDWSATSPRPKNNANWDEHLATADLVAMRNKRSVWPIATQPFKEAHFATFPQALIEPCILAGCPKGGVVLDPFGGSGTTAVVAERLGRNAILIEISKEYAAMAEARIARERMGPEERKRSQTKSTGKLKTTKGLPLFAVRTKPKAAQERDGAIA